MMENFTRMQFLSGAGAAVASGLFGGCRSLARPAQGRRRVMDYWCTWETQVAFADRARRDPANAGRDIRNSDMIDERLLFGKDGWAGLFPDARQGLVLLLDAGWDYPYGTNRHADGGRGLAAYGSMRPDPVRFPSLTGSAVEKLTQLRRRVEDAGWGGLGLWVSPQKQGEWSGNRLPRAELVEDMKRKLAESQAAGVAYWKVDIGTHQGDVWYCQEMSRLADIYAPDVVIDHSCAFANPLNGVAHPHVYAKDVTGSARYVGKTGRMIGVPGFEPWPAGDPNACDRHARMSVRELYTGLMRGADSFRSYDTLYPMDAAAALERAVFELQCADSLGEACAVNVEDNPLIGAALGVGIGVMRSAHNDEYPVAAPDPRRERLAEIARTVRWRAFAPVFASDRGCPVRFSGRTAEETWTFAPDSTWWAEAFGKSFFQRCPAVVARGLPLPDVASAAKETPIVAASRNPETGALSVASLPFLTDGKGRHTPSAEITLDAALSPDAPLGVFGDCGAVVLRDGAAGRRIRARDLAGEAAHDITSLCRREGGKVALPGDVLARIGRERNPSGDCSSPGVVVSVAG